MALTEKLTAIADAIRSQSGKAEKLTLDQMPGEIISLQSLRFEVVGNPKPENPKANTIWVDTDVEITGWDFSAAEPANPVDGMVWFAVGTASTVAFNALKENSVMVYPLSAKQYVSGAWVNVTAKSYLDGEWVDWVPSLTLVPDPENAHSWAKETVTYGRSEATDNEDGTKTLMAGTATNGTYWNTSTYQTIVDLTNYSVLKYRASVSTSGTVGNNAARVGVGLIAEWGKTGTAFATLALSGESSGEVDISALTGEHPVGMQAQSHNKGTGTTTVNLFELVLE